MFIFLHCNKTNSATGTLFVIHAFEVPDSSFLCTKLGFHIVFLCFFSPQNLARRDSFLHCNKTNSATVTLFVIHAFVVPDSSFLCIKLGFHILFLCFSSPQNLARRDSFLHCNKTNSATVTLFLIFAFHVPQPSILCTKLGFHILFSAFLAPRTLPDVTHSDLTGKAPIATLTEGLSIGDYIHDSLQKADREMESMDSVRHYCYEGDQMSIASLSSLGSSEYLQQLFVENLLEFFKPCFRKCQAVYS